MSQSSIALSRPAIKKTPPSVRADSRDLVHAPHLFFLKLTREYGDIVQYRAAIEPAYLLNHPDYVQHVLQTNAHNYNKNTFLNKRLLVSLTGNGLLTSENPLWRTQRRLIQPAFHRRSLETFVELMAETTLQHMEQWRDAAARGQEVDIARNMTHITLEIIARALFSYEIAAQADRIGQALEDMVSIGKPKHRKVQAGIQVLDQVVYSIIDKRRQTPGQQRDDLLDMLLTAAYEDGERMGDQQVRDEVMSLLVAGHETTANTLSWLWYLLAQHPQVVARLERELDEVLGGRAPAAEDLLALVYTKQVIEEGMRLYPSAWTISRRAIGDDEIGGYFIPANSVVAMSPYTMHRNQQYWVDPEVFDPERFTPERVAERPRYAYFPFGGGARKCIGDHFAMMESTVILAIVAQRYRMRIVPDHPVEAHALVTLRPRYGIRVVLEPRQSA